MELQIIGSSSAGNAYVLNGKTESLLIECGVNWSKIQTGLNYQIAKCAGCLISHEHGDHARAIRQVVKHMIPVYTSHGTAKALGVESEPMVHTIEPIRPVRIGEFDIIPFDTQHDAAEPFGFLIRHPECGTILFATDTYYLRYTFPDINHMMVECNYIDAVLADNVERGIIHANDMSQVRNVVLIHLSQDNSNERIMQQTVCEHTGANVIVAKPGIKVNFNYNPF